MSKKIKRKNNLNKISNFLLALILVLAFALRLYKLGEKSLWIDEIWSMVEAKRSLLELIFQVKWGYMGYNPVHFVFAHLMLYFGNNEFIVRLPSVITGVFAVYALYLLGKYIFDQKTSLIAAFLLAISSLHIEHSREVRYYSYLVLFSIVSTYFLLKFLDAKNTSKFKLFVLFIIFTVLNMATQPTAMIFLFVQIVYAASKILSQRKIPKIKINFYVIVIMVLTLVVTAILVNGASFLIKKIHVAPAMPIVDLISYVALELSGGKLISLIFIPLLIVGLVKCLAQRKNNSLILLFLFFLPLIIFYFVRPQGFDFHIRYIIYIIIPFILLISYGIASVAKMNIILLFILLIISIFSSFSIRDYYLVKKGDWRGIGKYLETNTKQGDMIIVEEGKYESVIGYYYNAAKKNTFMGAIVRTFKSDNNNVPFRRYFIQHQYLTADRKANPEGLVLSEYEKMVPFDPDAKISPLYVFVSYPIWFWQEAENDYLEDVGWEDVDIWGKKAMGNDNLKIPENRINYQVKVTKDAYYDLFVNLKWDMTMGLLKFKFDEEDYSKGFQPLFGKIGDINNWRLKEAKLGIVYLRKGQHKLTFTNINDGNKTHQFQNIDYFYLKLNEEKTQKQEIF